MAEGDSTLNLRPGDDGPLPGPPDPTQLPYQGAAASIAGNPQATAFQEIGVSGLKVFSGYVNEEYLRELRGAQAIKIYRQMGDNDPIVCAVLTAIGLILRAVDWNVEPANESNEAESEAEFVRTLWDDMSHPFPEFLSEVLSMIQFGWAYHEIVLKRRVGPEQEDPALRSKFSDGRIGIRKLPIRSQDSLLRWQMQTDGGIDGLWQQPPTGGPLLFVPILRGLLFRTMSRKNSPEGVSILRSAYRPYYLLKTIEDIEAIGIERELAGLPVVSIPAQYLNSSADVDKAIVEQFKKIARDLKFNQQGGIVIPSDCFKNADGTPSSARLVDVKLLTTGGQRAINTDPIIQRHQRNIARSALADFIMLGDQKGSYALSKNKAELFLRACEAYLNSIAEVINRFLLPRIWLYNGLPRELMPTVKPGRVAPVDLAELGDYITKLAGAGAPLFPDPALDEYTREVGGLPPSSNEGAINDPNADAAAADDRQGADDLATALEPGTQTGSRGVA